MKTNRPLKDRILRRVIASGSGCWVWQGCLQSGYGTISVNRKVKRVHRLMFEFERGPVT